jgi:hypothetical protein
MDHLTMEDIKRLIGRYPGWCLSLYMPAHRAGRETEQDPIRLKNLLKGVEERLIKKGLRSPEIQGMLEPAQKLLQDPIFWRYQSDGLAVFLSPEEMHTYRLPVRFDELVVISDRFHLKPLLPFFASDGHFYILALSQNKVRLFEGTRHTVDELPVENLPATMVEALQFERFEKQIQFHTGTAAGEGGRAAIFHGHDPSDEEKTRLVRWFRKVDEELMKLLSGQQSPLVLAGVEYYFPLYQSASSYPHILQKGLPGNPDKLRPEEIHTGVWPLIEPLFSQALKNAITRYNEQASQGKTISDVQQAVLAAHQGRVDTIIVPVGVQVWGRVEPTTGVVTIHPAHEAGDEDLIDLAAIQTLIHGGEIFAVSPDQMPANAPLAVILRY